MHPEVSPTTGVRDGGWGVPRASTQSPANSVCGRRGGNAVPAGAGDHLGMPVVAQFVFHSVEGSGSPANDVARRSLWVGLVVAAGCVTLGLLLAGRFDIPAATLLFPLLLAVAVSLVGPGDSFGSLAVPAQEQDVGYALIGLQARLRFPGPE